MKRSSLKILCAALSLVTALSLTACGTGNNTGSESKQETTAAPETTQAATQQTSGTTPSGEIVTEADLSKLFTVKSAEDPFAGDWQITDGTGSQLEHFYYRFDGSGTAYISVGTIGYIGTYTNEKQDGKDVFTTQLMFGLDGSYTYAFSEDKKTVTLTNTADKSTSTMKKIPYTCR